MNAWFRNILLLLTAFTAPAMRAQTDAEQVMAIGRNVLSMDDYMLAIQYFNQAIRAKPYLADPYYYRAIAKISLEDYAGAEADCSMAIERNKFKTESYRARGFARQQQGKDSLAVADYDIGLSHNPSDKYFLFYKSVALTELKKFHEADSTFSTLLRIYPKFEEAFSARARMRVLMADTVGALEDIDRAIKFAPSELQPYLVRADIMARRHNWEAAAADMDEAIRLRPHEADFYLNRAFLRYNLDDFFGAMADYNYTLELEPNNTAALFNRALLRYQVHDLPNAAADFATLLKTQPDNFHALFNLGLINLQRGEYRAAIRNFERITRKYPKFHTAFYAIAQAYQALGNTRAALTNMYHADDLVRAYVKNPRKNPLDRPAIEAGYSNDVSEAPTGEETEADVMDRYNRLLTVGSVSETPLAFNDRIKGRVQDRDINVDLAPAYTISFEAPQASLQTGANYFAGLDAFNSAAYIPDRVYLSAGQPVAPENYDEWFEIADRYEQRMLLPEATAADRFGLAIARAMLKDYDGAIQLLNSTIEAHPDLTPALLLRGFALQTAAAADPRLLSLAMADYDAALRADPRLQFAWLNKGNILSATSDFTSALDCYNNALALDPDFAAALFNRGITYLRLGRKREAFADLSRAGELGILPSYNLLKRMK